MKEELSKKEKLFLKTVTVLINTDITKPNFAGTKIWCILNISQVDIWRVSEPTQVNLLFPSGHKHMYVKKIMKFETNIIMA